jgi:2-dehydropantoate 2-reductase
MHVLCYGAGAIGSLVGGRLALSGVDVTLLARVPHVASIRTWGLILESPGGRVTCKNIDSISSLDDLTRPPDLIILTVKAYQTQEALDALRGLLRDGVPILTLQNGVGNEEAIAAVAGADRAYSGAITISASVPRPGVVRQNTTDGGIALAPVGAGQDLARIESLLQRAGFRCEAHRDYRAMKWSKLLLNMVTNASVAILDLSPQEVVRDPRLFHIEREAFLEASRVMRAMGLHVMALPGYPVPLVRALMSAPQWIARTVLVRKISRGRGEKMPSLWEDLAKGRSQSEVEVLNGAVVRGGERLGVPTPINAMLTEVLLSLASGRRVRSAFYRKPDALLSLAAPASQA